MESVSKMTATKPPADRQFMCDDDLLRWLADEGGRTVAEMAAHFRVTETAIRTRLVRLTWSQSVTRKGRKTKERGRPQYLYYIASPGEASPAKASKEETT